MIRSTRIVYIEVIIVVVYCNDEIRNKRVDDDDDDDAVVCELWLFEILKWMMNKIYSNSAKKKKKNIQRSSKFGFVTTRSRRNWKTRKKTEPKKRKKERIWRYTIAVYI